MLGRKGQEEAIPGRGLTRPHQVTSSHSLVQDLFMCQLKLSADCNQKNHLTKIQSHDQDPIPTMRS